MQWAASMHEDFGLTIEDVMRMPFVRFMALNRLRQRQHIEARNAHKRAEWRAAVEKER